MPNSAAKRSFNPARTANGHLIGKPRSREQLATPAMILDLDAFDHNLNAMARYCETHATTLRPHAKSHKSVHIAKLQAKHGAAGICVATVREAAVMVDAGVRGVLITSPVVGAAKLDAVAALLRKDPELMLVVDQAAAVEALQAQLKKSRLKARILIDIDVGMQRTGVPDVRNALALARQVALSSRLQLQGLQCYSGLVQHIENYAARSRTYATELVLFEEVVAAFRRAGLPTTILTGGGTGTYDIDRRQGIYSECQAGSYIFMDVEYNAVQIRERGPSPFRTALFLQSMVLSSNHRQMATVDAGYKSFAMDGPLPAIHAGAPKGAKFAFCGDEFGKLTWSSKAARMGLGAKVEFVTPHCDPTVNLHSVYHCVRGDRLVDIWPVDARGAL